jgi:hypothetical protein
MRCGDLEPDRVSPRILTDPLGIDLLVVPKAIRRDPQPVRLRPQARPGEPQIIEECGVRRPAMRMPAITGTLPVGPTES